MAYDEYLGERITRALTEKKLNFFSKKMMGGLVFMVNDKMFCGIHIDKKSKESLLMARIGFEAFQKEIEKESTQPMDFTKKAMKDFVFITEDGFDLDEDLDYWLELCVAFNPQAKASKK